MSTRDIKKYQRGGDVTSKPVSIVDNGGLYKSSESSYGASKELTPTTYSVTVPIFKDLEDFYGRNKDITTQRGDTLWAHEIDEELRKEPTRPLLKPYKNGDAGGVSYNYCAGEQCTARANRATNSFFTAGRIGFEPSETTKKIFGMGFSTTRVPTEEEVKNNPHFKGDSNFGSADAWDYMDAARKTSPKNIMFSAKDRAENSEGNRDKFMDHAMKGDDWVGMDIPLGSYILGSIKHLTGPGVEGVERKEGGHTARVVGFLASGEPLIADYGVVRPMSEFMNKSSITGVISVPGQEHRTFNNFSNISKVASASSTANYWSENIPKDAGQDYIGYHDGIAGSKNFIVSQLGISPDEYDRYAKIAMTIPSQESEYGNGTVYKALDWLGQTTGPSQLNMKNVSEIYKKTLKKIEDQYGKGTPQYEGAATVLYIRELNKYTKGWAKKGIDARERAYGKRVYGATDLARDVIQGTSPSGYVSDGKSLDLFGLNQDVFVYDRKIEGTGKTEKATVNLPYKQIWQDNKDYTKEVNDMLPEGLKFQYNSKGNPTIIKATYGNTIPNTLENNVFYSWQSPNALRNGDAQGNSIYYKKLVAAYKSLYGKLPSNRNGGEIIALSNRVSILNKLKK